MYFSSPWAVEGYYRGSPNFMGSGAEQGAPNQGVGPMAGGNVFTAGQGSQTNTGWSPTILYLFALVIAEMFVFGILARKILWGSHPKKRHNWRPSLRRPLRLSSPRESGTFCISLSATLAADRCMT